MARLLTEADLKNALPDLTTPQRFTQLRSGAVIRRDRWGIPHIKASDEYDLFFAQGFATAQDRLFQMDFDRMRGLGRTAEYLGVRGLDQDRYMRRRRMAEVARLDYALASDAVKNALIAYSDGVNAFLERSRALPVEYTLLDAAPQPWEPWHGVVVYKVRNTAEGTFQGKLWLARLAAAVGPEQAALLSPGCQPGSLLTLPPGERFHGPTLKAIDELRSLIETSAVLKEIDGGSNAWVVSGRHTASGLPLLAGDSHRGLEAPNVYYQVHLVGADFNVIGYAIPGFPMVAHFCHNDHVAWGMTYGGVDTQDLFVERFRDSAGILEYQHGDAWMPARVSRERIRVRDRVDETVEVVETHRGCVIAGDPHAGVALAIADPGSNGGTPWLHTVYRAMKATCADELETALDDWTDRVNNYVYADVHGNYGYALKGKIPIRDARNGWGPVAGWSGENDWRGNIPAAELPRIRNPELGCVVSCNQRLVDPSYPYYLTNFCSTAYRAERVMQRIAQLTGARQGIRVSDMAAIHGDVTSIPAQVLQKVLLRAVRDDATPGTRFLLDWDCQLDPGSAQAAVYEHAAARMADIVVRAHYAKLADDYLKALDAGAEEHWRRQLKPALIAALDAGHPQLLPAGQTWEQLVVDCVEHAMAVLEAQHGSDRSGWQWGGLHRSAQQHVLASVFPENARWLNPPRAELRGDGDTPCLAAWKMGTQFDVTGGSVNRYIQDPSNWSNSRWIVPLGASGHPASPHYADQLALWAGLETIPQLWLWDDIAAHTETEQALSKG